MYEEKNSLWCYEHAHCFVLDGHWDYERGLLDGPCVHYLSLLAPHDAGAGDGDEDGAIHAWAEWQYTVPTGGYVGAGAEVYLLLFHPQLQRTGSKNLHFARALWKKSKEQYVYIYVCVYRYRM